MPFDIEITEDAERQLRALDARDQKIVEDAIEAKLLHQPTSPTRTIKQLRPNPFAQYELRAREFRVLYNVDGSTVVIVIVGRKDGNRLIVEGEEFREHQDDPPE